MFKNYVLLAWRHLAKNKGYAFINIAGLASGMAITLLIALWIGDELSFDRIYPNHRRLAIGMITQSAPATKTYSGDIIATVMGGAFRQYPELFTHTALTHNGGSNILISTTNTNSGTGNSGAGASPEKIITGNALWAQQELPQMLGFHILRGNPGALIDPSTVLIARSTATALFGNTDPMGKTVKIYNQLDLRIGGIYADLPRNSSFKDIGLLLPWYNKANSYRVNNTDWDDHDSRLYLELAPGITAEQATARIRNLPTPHIKEDHETAFVYPLDRTHLYGNFKDGLPSGGYIDFLWLFGIIGAFVLLLACINFMNLSTARSEKRAKEVAIRKTIGSRARQLVIQFLSESTLLAFLALVVALILTELALPGFNNLSGKDVSLPWNNGLFWVAIMAFVLLTGILAGSYPAFYLSSFNPIRSFVRRSSLPRRILVVFQLTVSLILVTGTLIIYREIVYMKDRPVGYSRDNLLTVEMNTPDLQKHYEALRTELLEKGLVTHVAASDESPTGFWNGNGLEWRGMSPAQNAIMFRNVNVTPDYGRTIGWTIVRGRDFSPDFATDSSALVLNETAARIVGFKNPIGEVMHYDGKPYTVIGVARDMVTNDPTDSVQPAIFLGGRYTYILDIRLNPSLPVNQTLAGMRTVFKKYNPASPFLYHFVSDAYEAKFEGAERVGNLAAVFTVLAIFISCLGLFGLAAFVAEQRTKELGVRKVLGATVVDLWSLLSADFLKLTVVSMFIAIPVAYLAMNAWAQSYVYHAPLSWWIFAASAAGILLITLTTVSFQSLKAALMNPIKSLRTE